MVVSLKDETVYQLDSYLRAEDIESRRATIKTLVREDYNLLFLYLFLKK